MDTPRLPYIGRLLPLARFVHIEDVQLLSVIGVVGGVLPVDYRVEGIPAGRGLHLLSNALRGLAEGELHTWVCRSVLDGLEEERQRLVYRHHLLHKDVLLRVTSCLGHNAQQLLLYLRPFVHQHRRRHLRVSRAAAFHIHLS